MEEKWLWFYRNNIHYTVRESVCNLVSTEKKKTKKRKKQKDMMSQSNFVVVCIFFRNFVIRRNGMLPLPYRIWDVSYFLCLGSNEPRDARDEGWRRLNWFIIASAARIALRHVKFTGTRHMAHANPRNGNRPVSRH